jgi:hypothetical protein
VKHRRKVAPTLATVFVLAVGCVGRVDSPAPAVPPSIPVDNTPRTPVDSTWWSFTAPSRPETPAITHTSWPRNALDAFVLVGLEKAGLEPAPEENRRTLIRRASLDVRGLPPHPDDVVTFLADTTPDAYEKMIDRLLDDPAYGEHRAHHWLDVVRYADTHGLLQDGYRSIWPYRDYVVRAFNRNLPFDQFTVEQLAGDLLPNATQDQLVATGFGRCAMTTNESALEPEEIDSITAKDRVDAVSATWLGMTMSCASCHAHRFDPITQSEYYRFAAFFRNTTEGRFDGDQAAPPPVVTVGPDATPALITAEKSDGKPTAIVLARGEYNRPLSQVGAAVPGVLPDLPAGAPANRLGLAQWFVSPNHPLTARVVVNRFWAELFGVGIVSTPENFGRSGAVPTNQALLDWLAVEFRESGWDVKHIFRLLLTSATYRQSSAHRADAADLDPQNVLLSRGPRFRMDAEMLRDQALSASGLLVNKVGGPPVKPYQPDGIWESASLDSSNTHTYQRDTGPALFRRSLYTFWKRKAPPPGMELFDAPSREHPVAQRDRGNTPLQALVTMNDTVFVEAARHLAVLAYTTVGADTDTRLDFMGSRVLSRPFDEVEHVILRASLAGFISEFTANPAAAAAALAVGETPVASVPPAPEQAAWMLVASEILNLDEALNK